MVRFCFIVIAVGALTRSTAVALKERVPNGTVSLLQIGDDPYVHFKPSQARQVSKYIVFIHMPCTFSHTVTEAAYHPEATKWQAGQTNSLLSTGISMFTNIGRALQENSQEKQLKIMEAQKGKGGYLWGMNYPPMWKISKATGCNMFYTPPKYWPKDIAEEYIGTGITFGMLRDPYDRLVNDFRALALNYDAGPQNRFTVSHREGHMERETEPYQSWYRTCNVNAFLRAELKKVQAGDKFRGNCHLVPQAEFFDGKYGIMHPVDVRRIPESFNKFMKQAGYGQISMTATSHNVMCNDLSAYSLDEDVRALIREIYARDFELICQRFGYCDREEMTCLEHIPGMCPNTNRLSTLKANEQRKAKQKQIQSMFQRPMFFQRR